MGKKVIIIDTDDRRYSGELARQLNEVRMDLGLRPRLTWSEKREVRATLFELREEERRLVNANGAFALGSLFGALMGGAISGWKGAERAPDAGSTLSAPTEQKLGEVQDMIRKLERILGE